MFRHRVLWSASIASAGLVIISGWACDTASEPVASPVARSIAPSEHGAQHRTPSIPNAEVARQLAALRQLTAPFQDFERAKQAGWNTQITSCLDSPEGGMGFHYGNVEYIDAEASVLKPELLMYEPQRNGRMRLVGVEYIVPLTAWTRPDPPTLFGLPFHVNSAFGVWALHVWLWRDNPAGLFADWNPKISCTDAQ